MSKFRVKTGGYFLPVNERAIPYNTEWTVTEPAALWVDMIAPRSKFLANLPPLNKLPMRESSMMLPAIRTGDGSYVDADTPIPEPSTDLTARTSYAVKFGAAERASSEVIQDSRPDLVAGINQSLSVAMARGIDKGMFNGAGPASGGDPRRIVGLLSQAVVTNVAPTVAEISKAIGRMESVGAVASVLWCDPVAAEAMRGEISAPEWPKGVYGLVPVVSQHLPENTAVVADNSRVFVGLHSDISVAVSREAPGSFERDYALFRALARVAGVWVQESESVRVVSATLPASTPNLLALADGKTELLNSPAALAAEDARHAEELKARVSRKT